MFPHRDLCHTQRHCFPRVRGDVPPQKYGSTKVTEFSPRARGCSSNFSYLHGFMHVFPACAGMFPGEYWIDHRSFSFPRVRGDVPIGRNFSRNFHEFSPRARGCSVTAQDASQKEEVFPRARGCSFNTLARGNNIVVFPACAGMFLSSWWTIVWRRCFPRVRGDVPGQLVG